MPVPCWVLAAASRASRVAMVETCFSVNTAWSSGRSVPIDGSHGRSTGTPLRSDARSLRGDDAFFKAPGKCLRGPVRPGPLIALGGYSCPMKPLSLSLLALSALLVLAGCKTSATRTDYLSTYDNLERASGGHAYQVEPDSLAGVRAVYVEPVELRLDGKDNVTEEQAQVLAVELRQALIDAIQPHRAVVSSPSPDAARLRVALTRVRKGVWLFNLHPGAKVMGSGLGGAAIEAEMVDPSGRQLWALLEMRKGNQMEVDTFDELDDPRDAIEHWKGVVAELFAPPGSQP